MVLHSFIGAMGDELFNDVDHCPVSSAGSSTG